MTGSTFGDLFSLAEANVDIREWAHSFSWPLAPRYSTDLAQRVEDVYVGVIGKTTDVSERNVLRVAYTVVREIDKVYLGYALISALNQQGIAPRFHPSSRTLYAIANGGIPPEALPHQVLRRDARATAGRLLRRWSGRVRRRKHFVPINSGPHLLPGAQVIANPHSTVLERPWIQRSGVPYGLIHANDLLPTSFSTKPRKYVDLADELVAELSLAMAEFGCSIPEEAQSWMRQLLVLRFNESRLLIDQMMRSIGGRSPAHLLSMALGAPARRALAVAVRNLGGEVTVFHHGNSIFSQRDHRFTQMDLAQADRYILYTDGSVERLASLQSERSAAGEHEPILESENTDRFSKIFDSHHPPRQIRPNARKVLIADTTILSDRAPRYLPHDLQFTAFVSVLCDWFSSNGYEPTFQRHPQSAVWGLGGGPINSIANVTYDTIYDLEDSHDLIVMPTALTSVFNDVMCWDMPKIYIDLGIAPWFPDVLSDLGKTAAVLKPMIDEKQRYVLDPSELRAAVEKAFDLDDDTYVQRHLLPQ